MANLFLDLPAVVNGTGAPGDSSAMGKRKTITVAGSFTGTLILELSCDGGSTWAQIEVFAAPGETTIDFAADMLRVRSEGASASAAFTPNVDVGANDDGGDYGTIPAPAINSTGAALDVSAFGGFTTFVVQGDFSGAIGIEISEDGVDFVEVATFTNPGLLCCKNLVANEIRAVSRGASANLPYAPVLSLGAITDPGAVAVGFVPMGGPQLAGAPDGFASARGLFVNPQDLDAADDGDPSTAFITIQGAIDAVPAPVSAITELQRNVIYVAPGSYDEDLVVPPSRRIALMALGPVTLGDGALPDGASTTPRNLTYQNDDATEFSNARPQLVVGTVWHGSESSSTHTAFMTAWDISGDLITVALGIATTHELHLHRVKVRGDFDSSADAGQLNIYEYNCFFDNLHNTPNGLLNIAESTEYDGLITLASWGRLELCQVQGGMTASAVNSNLPPNGMYNTTFSGTYTGPAASLRIDAATNFMFKANGAALGGGATKTIIGDLVP